MAKFTLTHVINCTPERFWELFNEKAFTEALYREHLHFPKYDVFELRDSDREIVRKASATPPSTIPAAVQKLVGSLDYTEEGTFDKATKTYRWLIKPASLGEKMKSGGTMRVEDAGDGTCRRIAEMYVEVKMFGVGGMIESTAEKEFRDGWNKSAQYFNERLAKG